MEYEDIKTPEELIEYMNENIQYGVINDQGEKFCDNFTKSFQETVIKNWRVRTAEQILEDGVGHCYDKVEFARAWFGQHKINFLTFWICVFQEGNKYYKLKHTNIAYKKNSKWFLFESSFRRNGIIEFDSLEELLKKTVLNIINNHFPNANYSNSSFNFVVNCFKKPKIGMGYYEYLNHVKNSSCIFEGEFKDNRLIAKINHKVMDLVENN